jgi:hypothetical protein
LIPPMSGRPPRGQRSCCRDQASARLPLAHDYIRRTPVADRLSSITWAVCAGAPRSRWR